MAQFIEVAHSSFESCYFCLLCNAQLLLVDCPQTLTKLHVQHLCARVILPSLLGIFVNVALCLQNTWT